MSWQFIPVERFDEIAKAWDAFNAANGAIPFLHSDFIQPLLREFPSEGALIARHADAMGIVVPGGRGVWSTLQPSQLPLGGWMLARGRSLQTVAASLVGALPGITLNLGLTQLDPLFITRPEDHVRGRSLDYIETAWVDVVGDYEAYWAARGKNLRQNMAKQRRRLETEGVKLSLESIDKPADVARGLAAYGVLESAGWKSANGTAIHPDNAQGRFYRSMLERFCERGAGRIYLYRFDDRVVAVDMCIEEGPVQVILKTTYDESNRAVSPAFLMRQETFERTWSEKRIARIEFYGKRMEWHTRWTDSARVLYHYNAYRWDWIAKWHARRLDGAAADPAVAETAATSSAGATSN